MLTISFILSEQRKWGVCFVGCNNSRCDVNHAGAPNVPLTLVGSSLSSIMAKNVSSVWVGIIALVSLICMLAIVPVPVTATCDLTWLDVCNTLTRTCYFHPLNCAPFNNIALFLTAQSPVATHGYTIKVNPYADSCSNVGNNCTTFRVVSVFEYDLGHVTVPFNSFTIQSMDPTQSIAITVNAAFYNDNILSTPICGVLIMTGIAVSVQHMAFTFTGPCAQEDVVKFSDRVPVTAIGSLTGASYYNKITCSGCFTPLAIRPGDLFQNFPVAAIDTTGTTVGNITSNTTDEWAGSPVSFMCAACVGAISLDLRTTDRVWWTSQMAPTRLPDATYILFNVTDAYSPAVIPATETILHSSGATSGSRIAIIVLLSFCALMLALMLIIYCIDMVHKHTIDVAQRASSKRQ